MFDIDTVLGWRGNTVRDRDGEKITVGDVFLDGVTDRPAWIGVRTGWFGSKQSYVSLASARVAADEVQLPYDKELVKSAPQIDPDVSLTPEEEEALYRHYGEDYASPPGGTATPADSGAHVASGSAAGETGRAWAPNTPRRSGRGAARWSRSSTNRRRPARSSPAGSRPSDAEPLRRLSAAAAAAAARAVPARRTRQAPPSPPCARR